MEEPHVDEGTSEIAPEPGTVLDGIMARLDAEHGVLQEEALCQARQQREAIIPRLIDSIRAAADEAKNADCVEGSTHICALFLLWEFRATEALDAVVEALSVPGDGAYALFGDIVTECFSRILAVMAEDRLDVLDAMIRNEELDMFVRWQAVDAFGYLVHDGKMSRVDAVSRLRQHLREAIERNDSQIAGPIVSILTNFAAAEAVDEIRLAFEKHLVDDSFTSLSSTLQEIASGPSRISEMEPAGIDDAVEELRGWLAYEVEPSGDDGPSQFAYNGSQAFTGLQEDEEEEPLAYSPENTTVRYDNAHVGRNDPCPCGSGRKFKKCCGSRAKAQIDL